MKNDKNLDALFDALRNDQSQVSFGEISQSFRQNADTGIRKTRLSKKQWFTLKKLVLMLTLIVATGISLMLWQSNPEKNTQLPEPTNAQVPPPEFDTTQNVLSELLPLPDLPVSKIPVYRTEKINDVTYLQPVLSEDTTVSVVPVHNPAYKQVHHDSAYVFPNLTEEEKAENEKNKKLMLKQLEKLDKKSYAFIPSGLLKKGDSSVSIGAFYMSKTEVTNLEYRTFLFDLLIQGRKDEFLNAKPYQANWTEMFGESNKTMEENYFSHPAFDNYPVVNISRTGAEMYCKWLEQEANKILKSKNKPQLNKIRIPLRDEWIYAASAAGMYSTFPWQGEFIRNSEGCFLANYKPQKDNFHVDGGFYTVLVTSYQPNEFGLYNMAGNAAEMVYNSAGSKSAGTAGGGWMSVLDELRLNGPDEYDGLTEPHPNVGFRVVFSAL